MDRPRSRNQDNSQEIAKRAKKGKYLSVELNNSKTTEVCKYTNIEEVKNAIQNIKHRKDRLRIYVEYYNKLCGEISQVIDNIENFGDSYKEQAKILSKEHEKIKGEIDKTQEKALEEKEEKKDWNLWRSCTTSSSDYHNKRQEGENELLEKYRSLEELRNRAQELFQNAGRTRLYEVQKRIQKDHIRAVEAPVHKLMDLYKPEDFQKSSYIHDFFKKLLAPSGEYKQLQSGARKALGSLEDSFADMKEGGRGISFDQFKKQLEECSSTTKDLKNWVYSDYPSRVGRVLEINKCIKDLFANLPGDYRDRYQEKFDELREKALNPKEEHPDQAEKDYEQYLQMFEEIVVKDKPKRLSDLDKRAKDLIGKLPDDSKDGYQKRFDELRRKASSDSFRPDPLIAEKEYRQLIEGKEKEMEIL
jgi:hypothetical protein